MRQHEKLQATVRTTESVVLEYRVDGVCPVDLASLVAAHAAGGITFHSLRDLQEADPHWLEKFTNLDNETRSPDGGAQVPRSPDTMRVRLAELGLDAGACFVARDRTRWVGY